MAVDPNSFLRSNLFCVFKIQHGSNQQNKHSYKKFLQLVLVKGIPISLFLSLLFSQQILAVLRVNKEFQVQLSVAFRMMQKLGAAPESGIVFSLRLSLGV